MRKTHSFSSSKAGIALRRKLWNFPQTLMEIFRVETRKFLWAKNFSLYIEAKNNFFQFRFSLQCLSRLCNFDIFKVDRETFKAFFPQQKTQNCIFFSFTFPKTRVLRHTSSQGESFCSFWDAATYDKLYLIVRRKFVVVCCVEKSFSIGVPTSPTQKREISLFGFSFCFLRMYLQRVWG